jgi:hypothetical protein
MSRIAYCPTMSAESIAKALGRARADGNGWWRCFCPCHVDKRRPSLCLKDGDHGGLKIKCWSDCSRDRIEHALAARGLMSLRQRTSFAPPPPDSSADADAERLRRARWLLTNMPKVQPFRNTPAELYLLRERHLPELPPTDALAYWEHARDDGTELLSALVGIARDDDGDVVAVQLVYIDRTGRKVRKETRGFPKVASVRLPSRSGKRRTFIIAEGLETALSVWIGLGCEIEIWSVGGKEFLKYVEPPSETKVVILFADNDDDADDGGDKSREIYDRAAWFHLRQGRKVLIARPDVAGWDGNDFFRNLPLEQAMAGVRKTVRDAAIFNNNKGEDSINGIHSQHRQ